MILLIKKFQNPYFKDWIYWCNSKPDENNPSDLKGLIKEVVGNTTWGEFNTTFTKNK